MIINRSLLYCTLSFSVCFPSSVNAFSIHVPRSSLVADTCRDSLWKMTQYFESMVDTSQNRFYSLSKPQTGDLFHQQCPLRDLGATWDASTALLFWQQQQPPETPSHSMQECQERLEEAILQTLNYYNTSYMSANSETDTTASALSSETLFEPPNIAHSAFVIFISIGAWKLSLLEKNTLTMPPIDALTRGILSRQRDDGAFCITFDNDDISRGMEFYPGEAMTALMEVYKNSLGVQTLLCESTRRAILPAMKRAFDFYSNYYHQENVDTNYHIWQVQAFARLFHVLYSGNDMERDVEAAMNVADYVLEMCTDIYKSTSWKELNRGKSFYPNLQTVEIACGLDAIATGIPVAMEMSKRAEAMLLWRNVENAVDYLKAVQDQVSPESIGYGGLGYGGIQVLEQRLDVTGHAVSALTKVFHICDEYPE